MSLFDNLIKYGLPLVPRPIVGHVAKRYVAGETLDDAVQTMRAINGEGAMATVDVLGEEVQVRPRAEAAVAEYLALLDRVQKEGLDANISIKPTMLGLKIDEEFLYENVLTIVGKADTLGNFVRIDMEDSSCTDATIRVYLRVLERHPGSVGLVLQSYLRRTTADVNQLLAVTPNIRMCKGIYREARSIAWQDFTTIRANFIYNMEKLLSSGAYVGIATHDTHLVWAGMRAVDRLGLDPSRYEFQMLLGVDPELRKIILSSGHRLRVYIPYGQDWYPYSIRRLRENPSVAHHVIRAMLGMSPR